MNINKDLDVFSFFLEMGVGIFCDDHLQFSQRFPRDCMLMETGICPSSSIAEYNKNLKKSP